MPELVAERIEPPAVVAGERLAVLVEVRDVGKRVRQPLFLGRPQTDADRQLDRPEALGEGQLLLVGEILVVEDQHAIPVHAGMDGRDVLRRQRLGQVDARDLADEAGAELADLSWAWVASQAVGLEIGRAARLARRAASYDGGNGGARGSAARPQAIATHRQTSRRLLLDGRRGAHQRGAAHVARLVGREWPRAVHGPLVVPHDEIADPPLVANR